FSVVVSNPPFMKKDSARISPLDERALSRYELKGSLKELLHVSAHLAGKAGRLLYIYPTKRFNEMMEGLSRVGFAAVRLKFIHTAPHRPARFFMVEAARSAGREG
ncbi:MAG: hypothetical protein HY880_08200, partial [Deltaproteobacteria bacterium]|nr:hypothetical protein [Deltaproteobacteria bacterium]